MGAHRYIVHLPICDHTLSGKIAGMVQHQEQSYPARAAAKCHSGIVGEIQIEYGGIQAARSIRESDLAFADRMSRDRLLEPTAVLREVLHDGE